MIQITRLAHVAFQTPSMEAMQDYFTRVFGLWECGRGDDGTVHLTCGGRGAVVELIPGKESHLDHVALEVAHGTSADEARAQLKAVGLEAEDWNRDDPGAATSLSVTDPEGKALQLVIPDDSFNVARDGGGIRPVKLGHVATRTADCPALQKFYIEQLGFRFSDSIGGVFFFLRCNADHHAINFLQAADPGELHHVAFELETFEHTRRAVDLLAKNDIKLEWGPGRHGPGHNLFTYHRDPDGHVIEMFVGIDRMSHDGQGYFDPRPWHSDSPQLPREWSFDEMNSADCWGSALPETMMQ